MKKLLFILVLLGALNVNAQLVIKEAAKDTTIWQASKLSVIPKIVRFGDGETTSYTIYYANAKYTSITDIKYLTTGNIETSKQFYELCKTVIGNGEEINISLDNKNIYIRKFMKSAVMIWMSDSYFYLSDKNIDSILEKL